MFYTQKAFSYAAFARRSFYTETPSHRAAFTHRSLCTEQLLDTGAFTQISIYTEALLDFRHRSFYTGKLLHTNSQKPLHKAAFTHRRF